jgi:hypothetical protein
MADRRGEDDATSGRGRGGDGEAAVGAGARAGVCGGLTDLSPSRGFHHVARPQGLGLTRGGFRYTRPIPMGQKV